MTSPIIDHAGQVVGIIGISKDVRALVAVNEIPCGIAAALPHLEEHDAEPITPSG